MSITGALSHIDISVGYPDKSIPFYEALLTSMGYERRQVDLPDFQGDSPVRASWMLNSPGGARFEIEVRPARKESRDRRYDRYEPGPHHMAFHAENAEEVDRIYRCIVTAGATILDAPNDYSGQAGYPDGYYAVFFADPDGQKLEVVFQPVEASD